MHGNRSRPTRPLVKLRLIPWLIASVAFACQSPRNVAHEPAVVMVPSEPPDSEQEPASQAPLSQATVSLRADEERCDEATRSDARVEGVVRVVVFGDGLRCIEGMPVRELGAMTDEAARLVSLGVSGAVLIVDGSVSYGEIVFVMDALMTGGIGELSFSASP